MRLNIVYRYCFAYFRFYFQQLAAIFITRQVIGNIKEAIIPYIIEKLKLFKIGYDMTAAMSPDTLERQMREMTGIDTRDSSEERSNTEIDISQDLKTDNLMDPVSVKGSSDSSDEKGIETLWSEDVTTTERRLSEIKEMSPLRNTSSTGETLEAEDSKEMDSGEKDSDQEINREKTPDRERIAEEEKVAEKEITDERERSRSREKSLPREKTPSPDAPEDSEFQEEELLMENIALDNGKLATSGPTLTQAEVEASMKKVHH